MIAVLVPEVVKTNWWQFLLHNYRGEMLRSALLRHGDHRLVVGQRAVVRRGPDPDPAPEPTGRRGRGAGPATGGA